MEGNVRVGSRESATWSCKNFICNETKQHSFKYKMCVLQVLSRIYEFHIAHVIRVHFQCKPCMLLPIQLLYSQQQESEIVVTLLVDKTIQLTSLLIIFVWISNSTNTSFCFYYSSFHEFKVFIIFSSIYCFKILGIKLSHSRNSYELSSSFSQY